MRQTGSALQRSSFDARLFCLFQRPLHPPSAPWRRAAAHQLAVVVDEADGARDVEETHGQVLVPGEVIRWEGGVEEAHGQVLVPGEVIRWEGGVEEAHGQALVPAKVISAQVIR